MTRQRKFIIIILIIATIVLALVSLAIGIFISNQNNNLQSQTSAQTEILTNCDPVTNICTISSGVCDPANVYIHFCDDVKSSSEKCESETPLKIPLSPLAAGTKVNLNNYLNGKACGTVQMYVEQENSGESSLGACGITVKNFTIDCTGSETPVSMPVSFPTDTTPQSNDDNATDSGNQLAQPQFTITSRVASACETSGSALLSFTLTVTNISTVAGTITNITQTIPSSLVSNGITPLAISSSGIFSSNLITWTGSTSDRTFAAAQARTYTYQLRIPLDKLETYQTGISSSSAVNYDTSVATGNTDTFELNAVHNCPIVTENTVTPPVTTTTLLPETGLSDNFIFLFIGLIFILSAGIIFKNEVGKSKILKLMERVEKK